MFKRMMMTVGVLVLSACGAQLDDHSEDDASVALEAESLGRIICGGLGAPCCPSSKSACRSGLSCEKVRASGINIFYGDRCRPSGLGCGSPGLSCCPDSKGAPNVGSGCNAGQAVCVRKSQTSFECAPCGEDKQFCCMRNGELLGTGCKSLSSYCLAGFCRKR